MASYGLGGGAGLLATQGGWLKDGFAVVRQATTPPNLWIRILTYGAVFLLGTALMAALAPQTIYDALTYHLVVPTRYLAQNRIAFQPDQPLFGFPQSVEMLFGMALALFGRDTAAAPIHWLFGLLALIGTAGVVLQRAKSDSTARLAALILLSGFSMWLMMGYAYNDLAIMAYGVTTFIVLLQWQDTRDERWLLILGIVLGLALSVKLNAGALAASAGLYVLFHTYRNGFSTILRSGLVIASAVLVTFAPWAVKGILFYHNPIYPYIFGGADWNSLRAALYIGSGLLSSGQGWLWLFMPFSATIYGTPYLSEFGYLAGPWLLTLPFALIFVWRLIQNKGSMRPLLFNALLFGIPFLIYWWLIGAATEISVQTRLVSMGLPISAILGSLALEGIRLLPAKPVKLFFIFQALFTLSIGLELVQAAQFLVQNQTIPYLMGTISREDYLNSFHDPFIDVMNHLKILPQGTTVRFLWIPYGYYCPAKIHCISDTVLDNWPVGMLTNTADSLLESWKQEGDAYFLVTNSGVDYYLTRSETAQSAAAFVDARVRWLVPIWSSGDYTLLTWKYF